MRSISSTLQALEQANTRAPVSKLEFYRTMPVWAAIATSSASHVPALTPSEWASGIDNATVDADVYNGNIYISGNTSGVAYHKNCYFSSGIFTQMANAGTNERRMSVYQDNVYGIENDELHSTLWVGAVQIPGSVSGYQYPIALATVDTYALYALVAYPEVTTGNFENVTGLGIVYVYSTDSGSSWNYVTMDYVMPIPDDYERDAGNFFDAVRLDDATDVILVNLSNYGDPRVILCRNEVWSTPYHVLPIDIVDNYSYLKLGWLKYYDGVIYATGMLGRAGSTGTHAQEMGVVLRSTDGLRWSLDRYRYMGETPFLSPLLMDADYMYYIKNVNDVLTIYRSERTPIFGGYNHKVEVIDDILGWQATEPNHGNAGTLNIRLANAAYNYSTASCSDYISAGNMAKLYAGYEDVSGAEYMLLNTYGIDQVVPDAEMQLMGREWAYRQMKDVAFDQDWQWLSQTKHHDTCVNMGNLYSIGDAVPTVGTTDIENSEYNRLILLPTAVRPQGDDFGISATYYITNDHTALFGLGLREATTSEGAYQTFSGWSAAANAEANNYVYTDTLLGTGFGVFGYCSNEYNLVAAFCDVINQKLYLLRRTGNNDEDAAWEILDSIDLGETPAKDQRYVVSMRKTQSELVAEVKQYELDSETPVLLATTTLSTRYVDYDAGKLVGIMEYLRVPESESYYVQPNSSVIPRNHGMWVDAEEVGSHNPTDRFFEFTEGYPLLIGNEVLELVHFTRSQHCSLPAEIKLYNTYETHTGLISTWGYQPYATKSGRLTAAYNTDCDDTYGCSNNSDEFYWAYCISTGRGSGKSNMLSRFRGVSGLGDLYGSDYEQAVTTKIVLCDTDDVTVDLRVDNSRHVILPFFLVEVPEKGSREYYPGAYYNPGERILQHFNDTIHLCEVQMYDLELDKSMDWALKDVAAKAGILDFAGATASDDSDLVVDEVLSDVAYEVLPTLYNDFSVYCALHTPNTIRFTLSSDGVDSEFSSNQTGVAPLTVMSDVIPLDFFSAPEIVTANYIFVTLVDGFLSMWSDNRLVFTVKLVDPYKLNTVGNIYIRAMEMDIAQYELYRLIDGIIADQGMAAFDAAMRVIRDARVKLLPTAAGGLKISSFKQHPDLGTVPDIIYALQEQFSDRVPTHIRAVGAEIAEYFDHAQAAKYGILFHTLNIESLGEEESYREAIDTVRDALSYSEGILQHVAAQLEYEVEDQLEVQVETYDGRTFNQTYIIDSIERTFGPATLEMTARCRRKYDV